MIQGRVIKKALDKALTDNDCVFLVPHNRPDMDAIGACVGMNIICNQKKKPTYIVIDDEIDSLEKVTKNVVKNIHQEFNIIKAKEVKDLITDHSLLIILDTNKEHMISVKDYLHLFKDIFIIDHHRTDENTVKARYSFADEELSSTCEGIGVLLSFYGPFIKPEYANYLLAGIIVDTIHFRKNVSSRTYAIAAKFINDGADATLVNDMFSEDDVDRDRAVQEIVDHTNFHTVTYAIASDDNMGNVYDIEDIAKAADYLLNYHINASFALAYIDEETISISARSKGMIDVGKVMSAFGGGGTRDSAAARVKGFTTEQIKKKINEILIPTSYLDMSEIKDKALILRK